MAFKTFSQFLEEHPDDKQRYGLADPDPGELRQPHNPNSKDIDLAKQAVQLMMMRNAKWHRKLYRFLKKSGDKIPEIGHIISSMTKPKDVADKKGEKPFDVLAPNTADSSPAFFQK